MTRLAKVLLVTSGLALAVLAVVGLGERREQPAARPALTAEQVAQLQPQARPEPRTPELKAPAGEGLDGGALPRAEDGEGEESPEDGNGS